MVRRKQYLLWMGICGIAVACGSGAPPAEEPVSQDAVPAAAPETASETAASAGESPTPIETAPSANVASETTDLTVVPGERMGPVTRDTSRADLVALFGEAALQDTQVPVGEGFTEAGTTVNGGTDAAFSIIWEDEGQTQPAVVRDLGAAWQTPEGIGVGTPYDELQGTLGTFSLYGFGWDYQGSVILEGSNLSEYYGLLVLRLNPDEAAIAQFPDAYSAVQGDQIFASDDPNLPPLDLVVDEMIVYLEPPAQ